MKYALFIFFTFLSSLSIAQTQYEMNEIAANALKSSEIELETVFNQIVGEYMSDGVFIQNLKKSQKIWKTFRDAELEARYPEKEAGFYGSIHPYCQATFLEKLTRERISALQIYQEGLAEGMTCHGTVKVKE